LYCPEPERVDDRLGAVVDQMLLAWVRETGIFADRLDAVAASQFGRFAMLVHPDTDEPERLLLAAQCIVALFAIDDHYCDDERTGSDPALIGPRLSLALAAVEPAHLVGDYPEMLEAALVADPVLVGLRSYFGEVARLATPAQLARVRQETVAMFVTMSAEAGWRLADVIPPVWEHLAQRQVNSFLPCMSLIDIVGGYELPASVYFRPDVRRATTLAASVTICANDLYSAEKEAQTAIGDFNLPRLIAHEDGCMLQEAMNRTAKIHDALMHAYEAAERELSQDGAGPELGRWLAGVRAWVAGSRAWHATSARYRGMAHSPRLELQAPLFDLDPTARDVHGEGQRLRAAGPVVPVNYLGVNMWAVSHYESVRQVLSDSRFRRDLDHWTAYQRGEIPSNWPVMPIIGNKSMLNIDGPAHARLRGLLSQAFTPRRIAQMQGDVERIARDTVSGLTKFVGDTVDMKKEFALPLPLRVVSKLYGFHEDDYPDFPWLATQSMSAVTSPEEITAIHSGLNAICADLVDRKRGRNDDDLVCALLAARDGDVRLTEQEVVDQLFLLLVTGHETTAHLICAAIHALAIHPDQLELVRTGKRTWTDVVEEVLRWDSPAANVLIRFPIEDVQIAGTTIGKGEPVTVVYTAAGRDPLYYGVDAHRFDISRTTKPHLSFGHGEHFCLGTHLARMDVQLGLAELHRRFDIELAVRPDELIRCPSLLINGLRELPVRLIPRP
jgi:cytochrome P450